MQTIADTRSLSATTASGYQNDYRQTHSASVHAGRTYTKAQPATQSLTQEEVSSPETRKSRSGYLHMTNTSRGGVPIVIQHVSVHDLLEGRIEVQPRSRTDQDVAPPLPRTFPGAGASRMENLKAFLSQAQHLRFLKRASTGADAAITAETARMAAKAWDQVWEASGRKIPVPSAATNSDGKVFYSWDSGHYHLDLDIVPDEPASIFFCDRDTDEYWYEDYQIGSPLPAAVVAKLNLFA